MFMNNCLLRKGAFTKEFQAKYRLVEVRIVEMSRDLQERLNYPNKLNRDAGFIQGMIEDGETQGRTLLQHLGLL
jgi:hypothetical protein